MTESSKSSRSREVRSATALHPERLNADVQRAPGEIVRWVRFRSEGQHPIAVGYSLVVPTEDGGTTTRAGDSLQELREVARALGLKPVVTWSNSRVVISHSFDRQPKKETPAMSKTKTTGRQIVKDADGNEYDDATPQGRHALTEAAKREAAAVKEAKRTGGELPPTPVLDYLNSAEYRAVKVAEASGKRNGTSGGKAVRFDDATLADMARKLLAEGFTTKAAMLKEMRRKGEGARQQRFYPIADRVLDEAKRNGTMPETPKAAPIAKMSKAVEPKAAAKKSTPTKSAAKSTTTKAPASKKTAAKKVTPTKAAAKKSTTAAKVVTPNFKQPKTSTARKSNGKFSKNPTPLLAELMDGIVNAK